MAAIYKGNPTTNTGNYYGGGGESSGGHVIQDNGVEMIEREALNFVGLEVDDDATNGSTNVAAHRLTSAEMSEIMENLPVNPTSMPILFDETGAERVVGWYKTSSGNKPVYEKNVTITIPALNNDLSISTNNVDKMLDVRGFVSGGITPMLSYESSESGATMIWCNAWAAENYTIYVRNKSPVNAGQSGYVRYFYTKSTDTPS